MAFNTSPQAGYRPMMPQLTPPGGAPTSMLPQAPQQGAQAPGGFGGGITEWLQQNPALVMRLAGGLLQGPTLGQGLGAGFSGAPEAMAYDAEQERIRKQREALAAWLQSSGQAEALGPEGMAVLESNPELAGQMFTNQVFPKKQDLIATDEPIYDPNTGKWITPPPMPGDASKLPEIQQHYLVAVEQGYPGSLIQFKQDWEGGKIQEIYNDDGRKQWVKIAGDGSMTALGGAETDLLSDDAFQQQKELREAGATNITNTVGDRSQNKFAEGIGGAAATELFERRTKALDAVNSLRSNSEARALLDAGMVTGFGANFIVNFGKALQQVGIDLNPDAIANTEAYVAARATEIATIIKQFGAGTGLSDADREFAERAAGGKVTLTEAAIRKILELNDRTSRFLIETYNRDASQVPREFVPFDITVPMPEINAEAIRRKQKYGLE